MEPITITLAVLCGILAVSLVVVLIRLRSTGRSRDEAVSVSDELREKAPFGILTVARETGEIEYSNPAAAKLLRAPRSDLPGKKLSDITGSPDQPEGAVGFTAGDGSMVHLDFHGDGPTENGRTTFLLTDDGGRVSAQAALRDLEDRYVAALSRTRALVYTTNLETGETSHDGGSIPDLPGGPNLPVSHDDDAALRKFRASFTGQDAETPGEKSIEYRVPTEDGRTLVFMEEAWMSGGGGAEPSFVRGVILDVTRSREISDSLQETAQMRDAMREASAHGIVVRSEGRVFDMNPAGAHILGATPEELEGRTYLDLIHPDSERAARAGVRRTDRGDEESRTAMVWRRNDRHEVEVEVYARPIRYRDDENAALVFFEDVTARQRAKRRDRLAVEALERSKSGLEQFVRSSAEDLRRQRTQLAKLAVPGTPDDFSKVSYEMERTIEELSSLSSLPEGNEVGEVDLSEISRSVARRLEGQGRDSSRSRGVEVIVAGGLVVTGESRSLTRAMTILVENVWRAAGDSPRPRMVVGRVERSGHPVFFVRDNGPGLDMADAGSIFDASRARPGNDLPAASRIIERHGGRVWAESEPGRGTTYYFTL